MKRLMSWMIAIVLLTSASFAAERLGEKAILLEELVYTKAPFPSCHASTIVEVKPRVFLCAFFGGTGEGNNDVGIWLSRRDGDGWSAPIEVAQHSGVPCWNPVLFQMPGGETLLFYKAGPSPREWSGLVKRSTDGGMTWSQEELFPAGVLGPIRAKPILLNDGTLLCGSSVESWKTWACWMEMTSDAGKTWSKSTPIFVPNHLEGIIQPTVWVDDDGNIRMLARARGIGRIVKSISKDNGNTWAPGEPTELPNPSAGVDAVKMKDGRIALIYNHTESGRHNLSIAISDDDGDTWKTAVTLENQPKEYSYPAIIQGSDGKLHASYTYNRERIKYVILDPRQM